MTRRLLIPVVMLVVLLFGVTAYATLVDMNDGTIYDTDTQLSWLKDAGAGGAKLWADAVAWAASLNNSGGFAGLTGWRLPNPDQNCAQNLNCINSEMGHLYYTELGNVAGVDLGTGNPSTLTNVGPFTNLQGCWYCYYWTGAVTADPRFAWTFSFHNGGQYANAQEDCNNFLVWAVRSGARTIPCTNQSVQACSLANGTGQQTCQSGTWGICGATSCNTGYVISNGVCVASQPSPTAVGYNPQWLIITLVSLILAGGLLLRRRTAGR